MRKRPASPVPPESGDAAPVDHKRDVRLVASGVTAILLLWFALGNRATVSIDFWITTTHAPLILVIAIAGLFGAVLGALTLRRRPPRD